MNILNYTFEKSITKKNNIYNFEIKIPYEISSYEYKIYGQKGFIEYGKCQIKKNRNTSHIIMIEFEILEKILLSVIMNNDLNNQKEYFEFIDLFEVSNLTNLKKNINISIEKKNNKSNNTNINFALENYNDLLKFYKITEESDDEEEESNEENESNEDDESDTEEDKLKDQSKNDNQEEE
jgi:hypothetical protein